MATAEITAAPADAGRSAEGTALTICACVYAVCWLPAALELALRTWSSWRLVRIREAIEADAASPVLPPGPSISPGVWLALDYVAIIVLVPALSLLVATVVLTVVVTARARPVAASGALGRCVALLVALALPVAVLGVRAWVAWLVVGSDSDPLSEGSLVVVDLTSTAILAGSLVMIVWAARRLAAMTRPPSPTA